MRYIWIEIFSSGNHLQTIPLSIFNLKKLKGAYFSDNQITRVPAAYRTSAIELSVDPVCSLANLSPCEQLLSLRRSNDALPWTVTHLWDQWRETPEYRSFLNAYKNRGNARFPPETDVRHYLHALLDRLEALYAEQWEDLVARVLQSPNTELSPWELTRITWEATSGERTWLESQLPPNHPIILEFTSQHSMPLKSKEHFQILL